MKFGFAFIAASLAILAAPVRAQDREERESVREGEARDEARDAREREDNDDFFRSQAALEMSVEAMWEAFRADRPPPARYRSRAAGSLAGCSPARGECSSATRAPLIPIETSPKSSGKRPGGCRMEPSELFRLLVTMLEVRMIGTTLAHYEVLSAIGRGGMGEVWRARDTKLGRAVAIKTLPEEFAEDPDRLARFEREAKLLASLNHPNICTIYEVGEHQGRPFIAMEYLEGRTLRDRIRDGVATHSELLEVGIHLAQALDVAHEKGTCSNLQPAGYRSRGKTSWTSSPGSTRVHRGHRRN